MHEIIARPMPSPWYFLRVESPLCYMLWYTNFCRNFFYIFLPMIIWRKPPSKVGYLSKIEKLSALPWRPNLSKNKEATKCIRVFIVLWLLHSWFILENMKVSHEIQWDIYIELFSHDYCFGGCSNSFYPYLHFMLM